MMNSKKSIILTNLRNEYHRWQALLAGMDTARITRRNLPQNWSIQDVMAHLLAWQARSVARMEAGLLNVEPNFPDWPEGFDINEEEPVDVINAWIYEKHRDRSWEDVHADWKANFERLIELGEAIPEDQLLEVGRYAWLGEYALVEVLDGSRDHHEEHYEMLMGWLRPLGEAPVR